MTMMWQIYETTDGKNRGMLLVPYQPSYVLSGGYLFVVDKTVWIGDTVVLSNSNYVIKARNHGTNN